MSIVEPVGSENPDKELKALTSMRGIAALAVVAVHFSATAQFLTAKTIPSLVPHGYMAVDFFFVLSGFIMSYTYATAFLSRKPRAYFDFISRRMARVLPLHFVVVLLIAAGGCLSTKLVGRNVFFHSDHFWVDLVANLLLLPALGFGAIFNGPSWSISTEFVAYFLFPGFVWLVFNNSRVVAAATMVLAVAILAYCAMQHRRLGLTMEYFPGDLIRCLTEFTLGMGSFRLIRDDRATAALATDTASITFSIGCALSLALRYDLPAALLFPFLVASLAVNKRLTARALSARPLHFVGVISYSIYLIHNPLRTLALGAATLLISTPTTSSTALTFAVVGTTAVIPFAWVAYCFIERPGRKLLRLTLAARVPRVAG